MATAIAHLALVVNDYDEAIAYFTGKLGFELLEDTRLSETKRWVVVGPKGFGGCSLLLAKAADDVQRQSVGNQSGGRVFLFLRTDDFEGDYSRMKNNGVAFIESPRQEQYGKVVVFSDLYGNKWDLVESKRG